MKVTGSSKHPVQEQRDFLAAMNIKDFVPMRFRFWSGLLIGATVTTLVAALFSNRPQDFVLPEVPELQAGVSDGDYIFFPNRRHMWVVHTAAGRLIHYKFLDTYDGMVEKSYVAQLDQKRFPPEETIYALSERNVMDLLWVCNKRTGDFQLWRRNVRDGRLVTDVRAVSSAGDILNDTSIRSSLPSTRQ